MLPMIALYDAISIGRLYPDISEDGRWIGHFIDEIKCLPVRRRMFERMMDGSNGRILASELVRREILRQTGMKFRTVLL